ncbi:MAG: anti-sigma factor [Actinomycetota bacterium]|nr:anti-sigma factor [Actinomycetota bacterium]
MAADDDELLDRLADALGPFDREPPADRIAELRAAVRDAAAADPTGMGDGDGAAGADDHDGAVAPIGRGGPPRGRTAWLAGAAAVAVFVVAFGVGYLMRGAPADPATAGGVVEFSQALVGPDGEELGEVEGVRLGIGRVVRLHTDELEILPTGEFYEVWFVGPDDEPGSPDRISAGTFHPDEEGVSDITLTAAVDPALYPMLVITAEPGDGDPSPSPIEVARVDLG